MIELTDPLALKHASQRNRSRRRRAAAEEPSAVASWDRRNSANPDVPAGARYPRRYPQVSAGRG